VLSTDGLTAHVSDAEIEAAAVSAMPQAACEKLLETVLARGGTDNVTIVLVKIGGGNGRAPGRDLSRAEG
jgi:protein phosphatase